MSPRMWLRLWAGAQCLSVCVCVSERGIFACEGMPDFLTCILSNAVQSDI